MLQSRVWYDICGFLFINYNNSMIALLIRRYFDHHCKKIEKSQKKIYEIIFKISNRLVDERLLNKNVLKKFKLVFEGEILKNVPCAFSDKRVSTSKKFASAQPIWGWVISSKLPEKGGATNFYGWKISSVLNFFSDIGVSDYDKQTIVNKHNELRKLIANGQVQGQPRGVNLKRLVNSFIYVNM